MITRSLYHSIWEQLADEKAMVFMAGPRQVGKTTLARSIAESFPNQLYFNWDVVTDRARLIREPYFFQDLKRRDDSTPIVILDEIHKYGDWKNYLKGVYDGFHRDFRFLVAGSGRLDTYRKGGDSLAGRYSLFHLWPFTLSELVSDRRETVKAFWEKPLAVAPDPGGAADKAWQRLRDFTGFPEPFARGRHPSYRRWSTSYASQLIREDIRDLTAIRSISQMETLFALLPERVGSPLSFQSLSEDLKASYNTVRNWMETLERFFLVFTIIPWTRKVTRAVHKARKTYLFDYGRIENPALRFENMVALELYRAVNTWNDLGLGAFGLHFVRTKEGLEADFLLTNHRQPLLLVEAKARDAAMPKALAKIQSMIGVPAVQILDQGDTFQKTSKGGQRVLTTPAALWLPRIP